MINPVKAALMAKHANDCLKEIHLIAAALHEVLPNLEMANGSRFTILSYLSQMNTVTKKYVELTKPLIQELDHE